VSFVFVSFTSQFANAACSDVARANLLSAATSAVGVSGNGGYGLPMWVTMVNESGKVCYVINTAGSGNAIGNTSWLGGRLLSAHKSNTANNFSLDGYAVSSANLYTPSLPGNMMYGLNSSNPADAIVAYGISGIGNATTLDSMVGKLIGGTSTQGGGLALYKSGKKIGAIGVAGDTPCTDHAVAWRIRGALNMHPSTGTFGITTSNMMVNGTAVSVSSASKGDELIQTTGSSDAGKGWAAWAYPLCPNNPTGGTTIGIVSVSPN
jgi:uncharacterized protein GlcG (DUF336 family)